MPEYRNVELYDMPLEELISHLYVLGTVSHLQASYEMDVFYEEVSKTQEEIMNRLT